MSCVWVCASCRRTFQQQMRRARRGGDNNNNRNASYISFPSRSGDREEDVYDTVEHLRPRRRRRAPGYIDWQFDKSVENDFLQRISESRSHVQGPYSRDLKKPQQRPNEDAHIDERPRSLKTGEAPPPSASARVYKRNGILLRAHPLDLEEPTRRRKPWFGIPRSHTAVTNDEQVDASPGDQRYLSASFGMPSLSHTEVQNDSNALTYGSNKRRSASREKGVGQSFFDQYLEQARDISEPSPASPVKDTLQKLQTAHQLAVPLPDHTDPDAIGGPESNEQQLGLDSFGSPMDGSNVPTTETVAPPGSMVPSTTLVSRGQYHDEKHPAEMWKELLRMTAESKGERDSLAVHKLSQRVVSAWCDADNGFLTRVPKPTRLLDVLCNGQSKGEQLTFCLEAMWIVLSRLIQRSQVTPKQADEATYNTLLESVIGIWSNVFKSFAECYTQDSSGVIQQIRGSDDWLKFINSQQMLQFRQGFPGTYQARLLEFFPQELHGQLQSLDAAGLVTTTLLNQYTERQDHAMASTHLSDARSFFQDLLPGADVDIASVDRSIRKHSSTSSGQPLVMAEIRRVTQSEDVPVTTEPPVSTDSQGIPIDLFKQRIGRAVDAEDTGKLERIWRKVSRQYGADKTKPEAYAGIPPQLFAHFLSAFMALRRPNRAVDLWNTMIRAGVAPSLEHWDAMLRGCGTARDADAIETVWKNMLSAGVNPDAQLWTARIHALGSSGRVEAAVGAFQSMANTWLESNLSYDNASRRGGATKDADTAAPKPNTQCLNTLVGILSRANKYAQLVQILALRKKLQIPADSYTYNPLLKAALRDNNLDLASEIIQQMRSAGIKPDVATFTMMLDSAFQREPDSIDHGKPKEQERAVSNVQDRSDLVGDPSTLEQFPAVTKTQTSAIQKILQLMAEQSMKPTAHTFTTLVTGLLRSQPPNVTAAYGVLQYLNANGRQIPSQIFTALVAHHFDQDPPELRAVDALWHEANRRVKIGRPVAIDAFFYDRVIEGWARHGQAERALRVRKIAKSRGKLQSWTALRELSLCLVRSGDLATAQKVVNDTSEEEQVAGIDQSRSRKGSSAFWDTVQAMALG